MQLQLQDMDDMEDIRLDAKSIKHNASIYIADIGKFFVQSTISPKTLHDILQLATRVNLHACTVTVFLMTHLIKVIIEVTMYTVYGLSVMKSIQNLTKLNLNPLIKSMSHNLIC